MSNKAKFFAVFTVLGILFYFTPYLTLFSMKSAADAKDAAKLSSYVNFPALKENLKASFNAKLASETMKSDNPFSALGAAFASAFINPMIDGLVTPESLAMMMKGNKPQKNQESAILESTSSEDDVDMTMAYEDFDHFVVIVKKKGSSEEPFGFVLNRDGLFSWKLSSLRIPL